MRVPILAVLLLATTLASAAPTVTSIQPGVGLVYAQTLVTITGTEFSESDFDCRGANAPFCPVSVFFGPFGATGTVLEATPTHIKVLAPPRPAGEVGDVLIRVVRKGDVVVKDGFRWDAGALPSNRADFVRYLVPVTSVAIPGANGSLWASELTVSNSSEKPFAVIWNYCTLPLTPCPGAVIPANWTLQPTVFSRGDGTDGTFIYIPKVMNPNVGMSLRVRDLSKNAQSFGTEIPVVPDAAYGGPLHLVGIPTDPKYRATLRLYGHNESPITVQVSVFSEDTNQLIERYMVDLQGVVTAAPVEFPEYPSYAQFDPLTPAVRASGQRVRITLYSAIWDSLISPQPTLPVWGFLTVTNNETQQVTTVTPKR